MQIDKTSLDRLLSLDDASLAKTISALSKAAGIDQKTADSAISNLRLIRASLSNATDSDIQAAADLIGREKLSRMMGNIEKDRDGNGK